MDIQGENVELLVGGTLLSHWFDLEIKLSVDSFDTISFSAPFDPSRKEMRQLFQPFSYQPIKVKLNGDDLFTGTMIGVDPGVDANSGTIQITGYAQPGVLCDCEAPSGFGRKGKRRGAKGAIPLAFNKATLRDIANELCEPFGLVCEFRGEVGAPFEKVAIKIEEKIHTFLVGLAKQRGLVLTNNVDGSVLFWQSIKRGVPVVQLVQGVAPLTGVQAAFSPQDYYSEITGYAAARRRKGGSVYTYVNPFLGSGIDDGSGAINQHRPNSCKFDDTERADAPAATRAKVGRMFGNIASWVTEPLPTWRDPDGKLWDPNTSMTLLAPGAMIYKESELLIRDVVLRCSKDALTAVLGLVLPGAFSGEIPDTLPWIE
jgi:prophage tail gpP-like protein